MRKMKTFMDGRGTWSLEEFVQYKESLEAVFDDDED